MSSASRKMNDDCLRFSASIAAYVDGELDPAHAVDMEAHVIGCTTCAERVALIRAMRHSLKRVAMKRCPAALRARVEATITEESRNAVISHGTSSRSSSAEQPKVIKLRYAVGLAAAAGVAFAMGISSFSKPKGDDMAIAPPSRAATDPFNIDALLDELLALHANPFRPDTTDPEQLDSFDPLLGVRVRRPAFQPFNQHFRGARVHPVSDRGAYLQLQYSMNSGNGSGDAATEGKRLTVYIFNPRVVPVKATRLEPRVVKQRPVFVGRMRGYSVAALEEGGVGYAIASDTDESTRMVLSAVQQ